MCPSHDLPVKRFTLALLRTLAIRLSRRLPRLPEGLSTSRLPGLPLGERPGRAPEAPLHLWPKLHYRYISYRNAPSDLRTIWELSRFRWARPEDFPNAFESWTKANTVGLGPNWVSSLEVAVRAINWVFLLEGAGDRVSPGIRKNILRWLAAHGRHLLANPEPHPPNHALGRALGLFVLGNYINGFPEAGDWARVGSAEFLDGFPSAFLPDGTYSEVSPGYGAFALEMGLIYTAIAREYGLDPGDVPDTVQKGLGFLANLTWPDGSFPIMGDFDDGGILRPRQNAYPRYLFDLSEAVGLEVPRPGETKHYPDAGFLIIRRDGLCLAARIDDDPSLPGGHTHSDIGSFALWLGEPLVVDPGVYLYTGPGSLREELRSEAAHNLCWLEGKPMHARDLQRPFTMLGRKRALFSDWEGDVFVLRHDLFGPVTERRFVPTERGVVVEDSVSEQGPWRVGFTLAPGIVPEPAERGFVLVGRSGRYRIFLEAGEGYWSQEEALFCPRYGEKLKTKRLVFRPETTSWRFRFASL